MTEQMFLDNLQEMLPDLQEFIIEKAKTVFSSGAVDTESYEDNYLLPKIFLSAIGKEIENQYLPHSNKDIKVKNNLSYFL